MTDLAAGVRVVQAPADFNDWRGLLGLLHQAFAVQTGRIDPPSSLHRLDEASIAAKAAVERLYLAHQADRCVGCVFARREADEVYLGKLAVAPDNQGRGTARLLMQAVARWARCEGAVALSLDVRIELLENHRTFKALGFDKVAELAHPGYGRPTFMRMRKPLLVGGTHVPQAAR